MTEIMPKIYCTQGKHANLNTNDTVDKHDEFFSSYDHCIVCLSSIYSSFWLPFGIFRLFSVG
jgi:hypothetical protein